MYLNQQEFLHAGSNISIVKTISFYLTYAKIRGFKTSATLDITKLQALHYCAKEIVRLLF